MRQLTGVAAAALLTLAIASCGDDSAPESSSGIDVPTPEALAAALVLPGDLGAGWSETVPPDAPEGEEPGVVTDEMRELMPRLMFCDAADDAADDAAASVDWYAFRQLELDTGLPTVTPGPGEPPKHHLVFVQEFLTADEATDLEATFDALDSGAEACLGSVERSPDGEVIRTIRLHVTPLGDQTTGWRDLVREPGPAGHSATWDLHTVLVRDGEVLMQATIAEITTPGVDKMLDAAQIDSILSTMVDKLP